jgi:hypothetical protein
VSTVGFTGIDQMKTILIYAVLELHVDVTSLKKELGSMGRDIKGAIDTTSDLTIKNNFVYAAFGMANKIASFFCTVWSWTPSLR